jgi:hypothetical protein
MSLEKLNMAMLVFTQLRENDLSLGYLKKSIGKGNRFTSTTFQNDPDFIRLFDTDEFKEVLSCWH